MLSRAFLVLVFVLVPSVVVAAEPLADRNGDPLPEGAVARFGSARLLHSGVDHLEFSPDGKILATSGKGGVRLWDLATGKAIPAAHLPEGGNAVFAFVPDGTHLVGDADGCRIIDSATGQVRGSWGHGSRLLRQAVVAADGKTAAVLWEEDSVTVHNLKRGGKRDDWKLSDDKANDLCVSGDGRVLAYLKLAGGQAEISSIQLWDARQGRLLHTLTPEVLQKELLNAFGLSRDGRRLAVSCGDQVLLWDTASGKQVKGLAGPEGVGKAVFLRFSPDGAVLSAVSSNRQVWRWELTTGKEQAHTRPLHKEGGSFWFAALSPDGKAVATLSGNAIHLWDAASGKELAPVERWPGWGGAAFVGTDVVATHTRGREKGEVIAFWNVTNGRLLRQRTIAVPESEWWRRELSPDGKLLAVENDKQGVLLFDIESGKQVQHFDPPRRKDEQAKFAFSPDGKTIVMTDHPHGLRLWDVATGKPLHRLDGDSSGAMAFAPDGRTVASGFVSPFRLTEVASGKARFQLPLPDSADRERDQSAVERIRFARDGRSVATFSRCDIHVISTTHGRKLLHLYLAGQADIWSETGALSTDSRWLAHADNRHHAVAVRDLNNPRAASEYQTLLGHAGQVSAVEFSPDGKYLVSCASDGTALVWDTARLTGKPRPVTPRRPAPEVGALVSLGMETYWAALADADTALAARAMAALEQLPEEAVPLLRAKLKPAEAPPPGRVEKLVADLDSDTFAVRENASRELLGIVEYAGPALRRALAGKPSAEATRRSGLLLSELEGPATDPQRLRQLRAVEVLERVGTRSAREVLELLAKGAPGARLTQEAKASLARWPSR